MDGHESGGRATIFRSPSIKIDSGSAIRKRYLFEEKNIQFLSLKAKCTAATRVTIPLAERPC